ncbi:hypothetical protein [Halioxenophilus aromaticivorans]|uniref:Roadblock/LC7 domain-containing protein n=1 Tax=Halioxenophilus aromaticivorans TaxID=1306992 RepID=A0AAV3UAS6_9ALTE
MSNINETLAELMKTDGAKAAAVVDYNSGMLLGGTGSGVDLDLAAGGNTEVVRAKMKTMDMLGLDATIDDILITLTDQFHLIRPTKKLDGLFLYFVLDSAKGNLALARRILQGVEDKLEI